MKSLMVFCVCVLACRRFGAWTMFNAACFSCAVRDVFGTDSIDGERVRKTLRRCWWIKELAGGAHFRFGLNLHPIPCDPRYLKPQVPQRIPSGFKSGV